MALIKAQVEQEVLDTSEIRDNTYHKSLSMI